MQKHHRSSKTSLHGSKTQKNLDFHLCHFFSSAFIILDSIGNLGNQTQHLPPTRCQALLGMCYLHSTNEETEA